MNDLEKSEEQASIIRSISALLLLFDVDFCRESATKMHTQANRQESMAVINPNHPQIKNEILRRQATALALLCNYVDELKMVDKLSMKLKDEADIRNDINKLFI